jgi:hypothetical protein
VDEPAERRADLRADIDALGAIDGRFAGTEGERQMLDAVRRRLPDGLRVYTEGFVSHTSPALFSAMHAVGLLVAGVIGFWYPGAGAVASVFLTLSLFGEATGRYSLLRWPVPRDASYNLVVRQQHPDALGAVVIAAPLDVARWRPHSPTWMHRRPMQAFFAAAIVVLAMCVLRSFAEPWGPRTLPTYVVALGVLAAAAGFGGLGHRRASGRRDDASGPVVLVDLARRFSSRPMPRVDVWIAFTGCGRAYQKGMDAFLRLHKDALQAPALVISLDDPGRTPLRAVVAEGALIPQHHRPTGPALLERLRWAGVHLPEVDLPYATDARAAQLLGYRSVALSGGQGQSTVEAIERAADIVETVARWYGDDLAHMAVNRSALVALAEPVDELDEAELEEVHPEVAPVEAS